jgi:hypothetical protein
MTRSATRQLLNPSPAVAKSVTYLLETRRSMAVNNVDRHIEPAHGGRTRSVNRVDASEIDARDITSETSTSLPFAFGGSPLV